MRRPAVAFVLVGILTATVAQAQERLTGNTSFLVDAFPNRARTPEARGRVYAKTAGRAGSHFRYELGGYAEGLLASGEGPGHAGIAEVDEAAIEWRASRVDVRAGFSRAIWGRLDEVQPTDVVNPLDFGQFFLDSREAARLPVGLVRVRAHLSESATLEGIVVPRFRAGRFDRLDEDSSPFKPAAPDGLPVTVVRPDGSAGDLLQGGVRFSATSGRVDWSVNSYRGYRSLPVYDLGVAAPSEPTLPPVPVARGAYPRFTMVGGDFETAFSTWVLRGEVAVSADDGLQATNVPVSRAGRVVQAGLGADRRVAGFRLMGEVLARLTALDDVVTSAPPMAWPAAHFDTRTVSAVGVVERRFRRETRTLRFFTLYDTSARNALLRLTGAANLRDNLVLDATGAAFVGREAGFLGPFLDSDFVTLRLTARF